MTAWQLVLCVLDAVRHKDEYEKEMKLDLSSGRLVISVEFSLQPTYFIEERSVCREGRTHPGTTNADCGRNDEADVGRG